jgi:hypothetical protein
MRDKKTPLRGNSAARTRRHLTRAAVNVCTHDTPTSTGVSILFMTFYPPFSIHPTNAGGGYGAKV